MYHGGISFGEILKLFADQITSNGFDEFLKLSLSLNKALEHWDDPLHFDQTLKFVCGKSFQKIFLGFYGTETCQEMIKAKLLPPVDLKAMEAVCGIAKYLLSKEKVERQDMLEQLAQKIHDEI